MEKPAHLKYNDLAPDPKVTTGTGERIQLSSLWAEKPVLLAFTRHFGCPHCKEMLSQLVELKPEIEESGLTIAAVTQGTPAETLAFCERQAPGIACLSDPERKVYAAYGLGRGSAWQVILSPQVIKGTLRARQHGHKAELPPKGQDVRQMSGTFIVGTDGRIRLPYYYDTIADHAPLDVLLTGVLSTRWDKPFDGPLAQMRRGVRSQRRDLRVTGNATVRCARQDASCVIPILMVDPRNERKCLLHGSSLAVCCVRPHVGRQDRPPLDARSLSGNSFVPNSPIGQYGLLQSLDLKVG